jgi:lysophospholipase L1-like esterase
MHQLNVRMIILEFGGNATSYMANDSLVMSYKNKISRQISYLKRIYPSADILFIGPADMSKKIDGVLQTYPNLESIVKCLKEAALENGAAFWSMYDVMGGKNSMIKWAEHQPAWASKDYVHFTRQGANRIAELFVQTFMIYYDYYHFLKRHPHRNVDDIIMKL